MTVLKLSFWVAVTGLVQKFCKQSSKSRLTRLVMRARLWRFILTMADMLKLLTPLDIWQLMSQSGKTNLADMTDERFRQYLYHPELPDIDMMVRTSGECRVSGFSLWRIAYSEFMFLEKKWPDITSDDLDDVIAEYSHRNRRFGK